MPMKVDFLYVCRKSFDELRGGTVRRYCDTCHTDVINLDALTEEAALRLFEEASRTGVTPCVSAIVPPDGVTDCSARLLPPRATAGIPRLEDRRSDRRRLREVRAEREKHSPKEERE